MMLVHKFIMLQEQASEVVASQVYHFYTWMCFTLCVPLVRAAARRIINQDIRKRRRIGILGMARIEYYVDLSMWNSFMIGCICKLHVFLVTDHIADLLTHGSLTHLQISILIALIWVFSVSWTSEVILRFLWLCVSSYLEADFEASHVHRMIEVL